MKAMAGKVIDPQLLERDSEISSAPQYERSVAQELTDKVAAIERLLDIQAPAATPGPR